MNTDSARAAASRVKGALGRRAPIVLEMARYGAWTARALARPQRLRKVAIALGLVLVVVVAAFVLLPSLRTFLILAVLGLVALFGLYTLAAYLRVRLAIREQHRDAAITHRIETRVAQAEAAIAARIAADMSTAGTAAADATRQSRQVLSTLSSRVDTMNLELRSSVSLRKDEMETLNAALRRIEGSFEATALQEASTRKRINSTIDDIKGRFTDIQARLDALDKGEGTVPSATRREVSHAVDLMSARLAEISSEARTAARKVSATFQAAEDRLKVLEGANEDALKPLLDRIQALETEMASRTLGRPQGVPGRSNISSLFADRR